MRLTAGLVVLILAAALDAAPAQDARIREAVEVAVTDTEKGNRQAFLTAAAENDVETLTRLLGLGVDIEAHDERGRTALLIATVHNAVAAAEALIGAGADVNAMDDQDDSPFLYAGAEGRLEILRLTLAAGADLASTNRYGGTALIPAAHHGHVETVRVLLEAEIDIDHVNKLGWTALIEAIILGDGGAIHSDIVRLLVAAGADVNLADGEGTSPLAHARQRGFETIAGTLVAAGAEP